MNKVIIAVICYYNEAEVVDYVKNIAQQTYKNVIVLICCNAIKNKEYLESELKRISIETRTFYPEKNLGYFNGCLYAVRMFKEMDPNDIIIISNTDIAIDDINMLGKIDRTIDDNIAVIAPIILMRNGVNDNPFLMRRPSVYKILLWRYILGIWLGFFLYNAMHNIKNKIWHIRKSIKCQSGNIYSAQGSFMIFTSNMMRKMLQQENDIFLYGEEIYVAEVARKNNLKIVYDDRLVIKHNENSSTKYSSCKRKASWYKQSYTYIYNEFFRKQ